MQILKAALATYLVAISGPAKTANGVYMSRYYFGYTAGQEIPNNNTTVITADCQQCAVFVEGTGNCQRYTI